MPKEISMADVNALNFPAQAGTLGWHPLKPLDGATDEDVAWASQFCMGTIRRRSEGACATHWEVAAKDEAQAAVYENRLNIALADLKRRKAIEIVSAREIDTFVANVLRRAVAGPV